jgi:toxin ParE2
MARSYFRAVNANTESAFVSDVELTLRRIQQFPLAGFEIETGIRRRILTRFPYSIVYAAWKNELYILGVFDQRQKPIHWSGRLGPA